LSIAFNRQVFTSSEARQNLAKLLVLAQKEEVEIRRKDGMVFSLVSKKAGVKSPFNIGGVDRDATMQDILAAVHEPRSRYL